MMRHTNFFRIYQKAHNNGIFPIVERDLPLQLRKDDCMKSVKI